MHLSCASDRNPIEILYNKYDFELSCKIYPPAMEAALQQRHIQRACRCIADVNCRQTGDHAWARGESSQRPARERSSVAALLAAAASDLLHLRGSTWRQARLQRPSSRGCQTRQSGTAVPNPIRHVAHIYRQRDAQGGPGVLQRACPAPLSHFIFSRSALFLPVPPPLRPAAGLPCNTSRREEAEA